MRRTITQNDLRPLHGALHDRDWKNPPREVYQSVLSYLDDPSDIVVAITEQVGAPGPPATTTWRVVAVTSELLIWVSATAEREQWDLEDAAGLGPVEHKMESWARPLAAVTEVCLVRAETVPVRQYEQHWDWQTAWKVTIGSREVQIPNMLGSGLAADHERVDQLMDQILSRIRARSARP